MDREDEEHHEARGWGESSSSRPEAAGLGMRVGLAMKGWGARAWHAWRQGAGRRRQGLPGREQVLRVGSLRRPPARGLLARRWRWEVNTGRSEFWSPVFRSTYLLTYVFAVGCEDKPPFVESTRDNRLFDCS